MESKQLQFKYYSALKISLIYLIVSSVYIIFSDRIILSIIGSSAPAIVLINTQSYKDLAVVLITSILIFGFIQREINSKRKYILDLESKKKNLEDSELKFRTLFESMALGVIYQNRDGEITDANKAAQKILGLTLDQMQGKSSMNPDWKTIHEDGSDFPGETHPSMVALKTGKEVGDAIMGVFNPTDKDYRWINIDAIPQFRENESTPFQVFTTFDDITKQRRIQQRLNELFSKYQSIIHTANIAIAELDTEGRYTFVNPTWEEMFGYTSSEALGKETVIIIPPDDTDYLLFNKLRNGKITDYQRERKYQSKNGKIIWCDLYVAANKDLEGNLKSIVGVMIDITERKEAEQKLTENELKYKNQVNFLDSIIENSPFAMWIADPNGYLVRVNQVLRDTLEIPSDMDITKYNILEDENFSNQGLTYILDDVFKNHKSSRFEMFWLGSETGEDNLSIPKKLWVFGSMYPIIDQSGKLINVIFQYVDITERKEAEQKLKESEEKFFKIFQSSPNAILLSRLSDYKILNVNASIHSITGYTSEDLTSKKHSQFNIWKSADDRDFFTDQMVKNGSVKNFEAEFIHKSGEIRIWRTSGEIIEIRGEKFVLGIIEDITDLKRANNELIKQAEFINTMTENQPSGVVACDANGELVLFNKAAKEWHGIDVIKNSQQEWAKHYGLYNADGISILETDQIPLIKAYNGEKVENYEIIIKATGQKPRLVSCNGASFFNQEGIRIGAVIVMNDITQQKETENNLIKSEELAHKALAEVERSEFLLNETGKLAKVGGWDLDLSTMTPYFSEATSRLFEIPHGTTPKIEEGINFYAPEAREIIQNAVNEAIEKHKPYDIEVPFITAKGNHIWVRTIGQAQVVDGKAKRIYGAMQDITNQKKILKTIEESQARYKTLFENQPTIIWEEDFSLVKMGFDDLKSKGVNNFREYFESNPEEVMIFAQKVKIIEVNETSLEILEAKSKEEIITNLPFYFDSEKAWELFKEELIVLAEGGLNFVGEIPVRTIKGNRKQLYLKLVVHPDNKKDLKRILVTFQDITELKKAQKDILRVKFQLEAITNNLPGAVIQYKIYPDGKDELQYVSEGSKAIWGISPEEAMMNNQIIWEQIDNDHTAAVKKSIEASYQNIMPWHVEFKNNLPDGSVKWIEGIGVPKKHKDGSVVWDSIMLDISSRKEAENKLNYYQESLQNLTTEISLIEEKQRKEIAANIHDHLSQSLVISKMKLTDLQKEIQNPDYKKEVRQVIEHITNALENSRKITYDLSPPVLYELGLIETLYWFVEKIEEEHNLKASFTTELDNLNLPEQKLILLFRIIQELVNNTVKHALAKKIEIILTKEKEGMQFKIRDDGKGFDIKNLNKIRMGNTGFGLFTVRERAQNLGGEFLISSEIGTGTEITIYIPLQTN